MRALNPFPATRVVAAPSALEAAGWPADALVLRLAPDEVLIIPPAPGLALADAHALIEPEGAFYGVWLSTADAEAFLERACAWPWPTKRPAFAQGAVAGVPVKMWFEAERVLFLVAAPFAADLEERLA